MIEVTCTKFECDEDLSKYTDSMLFDSGENIAHAEFVSGEKTLTLDLRICGDVRVIYNDDIYLYPSEFPDELRERIKANPYRWDDDPDIEVGFNNWFETIYNIDDYTDGVVFEEDLSKFTPETLKNLLTEWARECFDWWSEQNDK